MGAVVSIGVLVGLSLSTLAHAGDAASNAKARAHFRTGMARYVLNHYEEAILEFEAGYASDPIPAFLFNLAQCHAKAGRKEKAIEFYRKYLDMGAPTQDAIMVQEAIERLERELRAPPPVETPPPTIAMMSPATAKARVTLVAKPEPVVGKLALTVTSLAVAATPAPTFARELRTARTKKYAGIATAAVGVAALAAGLGLSLTAKSYSDNLTLRDETHGVFDQSLASDGKTFDTAGAAMLAIGGVALVAGMVVAVLGFRDGKRARLSAAASSLSVVF